MTILTIAAACIGIPLAAIGIVALGRSYWLRPVPRPVPPASWMAKMERGE